MVCNPSRTTQTAAGTLGRSNFMYWAVLLPLIACNTSSDKLLPVSDSSGDTGGSPPWATVGGASADALGNEVAAAGDLDGDGQGDVLVAAYLGNRVCVLYGPIPAGAALLEERAGTCLIGESDADYAGYGIGAPGDLTGDGLADVLIGAIGNRDGGENAGKAYLLAGPLPPGDVPIREAALAAWSGEAANDYAGIGLASGGDLTGDGLPDLLIGATGYDGEGGGGGRAYIVAGPLTGGPLTAVWATITGLGAEAAPPHAAFGTGDFIGSALVGGHDLDGDGLDDLALGASGDQSTGINTGKVAVFYGPLPPGPALISSADALIYGVTENGYAGSPMRGAPDLTGDGRDDLLVSADGTGAGSVYLLSPGTGESLLSAAPVRLDGAADGDLFGYSIARPLDLDLDGYIDLAIGATAADGPAVADTGAVAVFSGPFTPGVRLADRACYGEVYGDSFGSAVDAAPDLLPDGLPGLIIGAPSSDESGGFAGKLYLFDI